MAKHIYNHCPNCGEPWADEELRKQECILCGYPTVEDDDDNNEEFDPESLQDI